MQDKRHELNQHCNYGFSPMPADCYIEHVDCNKVPSQPLCIVDTPPVHQVPEPVTYMLMSVGLIAIVIIRSLKGVRA